MKAASEKKEIKENCSARSALVPEELAKEWMIAAIKSLAFDILRALDEANIARGT